MGSISNRRGTMNRDPFCGKQNGSRAAYPALSGGHVVAWPRMCDADPALPLKAGRRVGHRLGCTAGMSWLRPNYFTPYRANSSAMFAFIAFAAAMSSLP